MTSVSQSDEGSARGLFKRIEAVQPGSSVRYKMPREGNRYAVRSEDHAAYEDKVLSSINAIEHAAGMFTDIQERFGRLEDDFHTLNEEVTQLSQQKEAAYQELARADEMIRAEHERANRAEHQAEAAEARVAQLEQQVATMGAQLDRMIEAVSDSFLSKIEPTQLHKLRQA